MNIFGGELPKESFTSMGLTTTIQRLPVTVFVTPPLPLHDAAPPERTERWKVEMIDGDPSLMAGNL